MTLLIVLTTMSGMGPAGAVATAAAPVATLVAAPAVVQPAELVTALCAQRRTGQVRALAGAACPSNERRLRTTVADQTTLCLTTARTLRVAGTKAAQVDCRRTGGRTRTVSSNKRVLACVAPNRAVRWIWHAQVCGAGEQRIKFKNVAPRGLRVAGATVVDGAPAGTVVGLLSARDRNLGDRLGYRLVTGQRAVDNADFEVRGTQLLVKRSPELAAGAKREVRLQVTDLRGKSLTRTFPIVVERTRPTDVVLTPAAVDENLPSGTAVGRFGLLPDDRADVAYELIAGDGDRDNSRFTVLDDALLTATPFDHETADVLRIRVRATTDEQVLEQELEVQVTNVNEAPTDLTLDPARLAETETAGTVVGELSTTDPDVDDSHTYALVAGAGDDDNARFDVVGNSVRTVGPLRFSDGSTRSIRVRTTDADGESLARTVLIGVTRVPKAPTAVVLSPSQIAENDAAGTVVGMLSALDPDAGDTHAFALVPGAGDDDNGDFEVDGLQLRATASFDFENRTTRSVRIKATDSDGLTVDEQVTIRVTNVNEAPTGVALSPSQVAENDPAPTVVGALSASDPDADDTHTFTLVPGIGATDNGDFEIVASQLRATASFDFESEPTRTVRVRATDAGGAQVEKQLTVQVTNVNEAPTGLALSPSQVAENEPSGTVVGTLSASDPDADDTHTFALVAGPGGVDNLRFEVVAGRLRTKTAFNHEDAAIRSVRVRVTDAGGLFHEAQLTITVTDVDETPTGVDLSSATVAENRPAGTSVGRFSAVPAADPAAVYTLVSGAGDGDNGRFSIVGDELLTAQEFDHEASATLLIRVQVTAHGVTIARPLSVQVTNVNEAPTGLSLSASAVAENLISGTTVGSFVTVEPDLADTHAFALVSGAGDDDNSSFEVVGPELRTNATFDFESRSAYTIRVRVTDAAGLTFVKQLTITITNVNEEPTDFTLSASVVAENRPANTAVGSFSVIDPDAGDTHLFTFAAGSGDTDNARFRIVGGVLETAHSFDFETTSTYTVRVRATDSGGWFLEGEFTVTVTDVDEAPVVGADTVGGAIGNTQARFGAFTTSGPTVVLTGNALLANDADPEGEPVSVVANASITTTAGGSVSIAADGTFRYRPKAGFKNAVDQFSYTVTDGTLSATGTVQISVGSDLVWYVDPSVAGPGTGTSADPYLALSPLVGAGDLDTAGDRIFLHAGTHQTPATTGLVLETNQQVLGAEGGLVVGGTTLVAPGGTSTLSATTSAPALVLAEGAQVASLKVQSISSGAAVLATNVNTATVSANALVTGGTGPTIKVSGGNGALKVLAPITPGTGHPAVQIDSRAGGKVEVGPVVTVGAGTSGGIVVVGASTAATVEFSGLIDLRTGTRSALDVSRSSVQFTGTANKLVTTSGTPLSLFQSQVNGSAATFAQISSTSAVNGIRIVDTGATNPVRVNGGTIATSTQDGVLVTGSKAPVFNDIAVTGGAANGVFATNLTGPLTLTGVTLSDNAADGLLLQHSTGAAGVELTDSTMSGNLGDHIQVSSSGGTLNPVLIKGNTLAGGTVGAFGQGIVIHTSAVVWFGQVAYDIDDNTITGAPYNAIVVASTSGVAGSFGGQVRNNRIGSTLTPCAIAATGIEISNEGGPLEARTAVVNNQIHGCDRGIRLIVGDGEAGLQATVTGNMVQSRAMLASHAFDASFGVLAGDSGSSCLNLAQNTFLAPVGIYGARLAKRYGDLRLPGYTGGATDANAVSALLGTTNPGVSFDVVAPTTGAFVQGTCLLPTD